MSDEIKIYHVDDPNDAPERRLSAFPLINPFVPTTLPQYVIPSVADSLYTAMRYYWSAYQQGIAAQRHQQHQQRYHSYTSNNTNSYHLHQHLHQHPHQHQHPHPHQPQQPHHHLNQQHLHHLNQQNQHEHQQLQQQQQQQQHQHQNQLQNQLHHHQHNEQQQNRQQQNQLEQRHQNRQEQEQQQQNQQEQQQNQQHIKKPLNPFMIYMQRMRPKIVEAGRTRESAEINKELGQLWRQLSKEEQEPYYKLAEEEKKLHASKYPGWSARDNYQKKKKKMKLKSISINDQSDKKCRARFGLSNFSEWCKPCKRKKKCQFAIGTNTNSNSPTM